jgi:hypothetical protein
MYYKPLTWRGTLLVRSMWDVFGKINLVELVHVHKVSDCARFFPRKPFAMGRCCLLFNRMRSAPRNWTRFAAQYLARGLPCETLHVGPRGTPRITRGRGGVLSPPIFASLLGALRVGSKAEVKISDINVCLSLNCRLVSRHRVCLATDVARMDTREFPFCGWVQLLRSQALSRLGSDAPRGCPSLAASPQRPDSNKNLLSTKRETSNNGVNRSRSPYLAGFRGHILN